MKLTDLEIGTKLLLEFYDLNKDEKVRDLVSQLVSNENTETAAIAAPISEGIIYPIRIGTMLEAYFEKEISPLVTEKYRLRCKVINRGLVNNIKMLYIAFIGIDKIQRRDFVRLFTTIDIMYSYSDTLDDTKVHTGKGVTKDISGGGLCILINDDFEKGKILNCKIQLEPQEKEIVFTGKLERLASGQATTSFKHEAGISFVDIENKDRERIIKFIFKKQREMRKRGLI